jgi:DNA-binding HxlR family transcriptional regulator
LGVQSGRRRVSSQDGYRPWFPSDKYLPHSKDERCRHEACHATKDHRSGSYSCGLEAALELIGGKWKVLVLWALRADPQRFGELRLLVAGISEKMLIQHLKEMQADGIVTRKDFKEVPPRVEYALTPFGKSLYAALAPLCEWGTLHMNRIEARKEATEAETRQRVRA